MKTSLKQKINEGTIKYTNWVNNHGIIGGLAATVIHHTFPVTTTAMAVKNVVDLAKGNIVYDDYEGEFYDNRTYNSKD